MAGDDSVLDEKTFVEKNSEIARKWVKEWAKNKDFEPNMDSEKEKFMITFPFPYVNGAPHIGHAYSAMRADVYARYKRLKGFNVLYPQGFHATGEPILGIIERVKKGDENQIKTLKTYGATDEDIEKFTQDPKNIVMFFREKWIRDFKSAGFSIDWTRTFTTTEITPAFSKFVEWQYRKLHSMGYITQGTHPVIWCPHDESPTGDHDRLEGEGESPQEFKVLLFPVEGERYHFACATLRPETLYAVTNVWLADSEYVIAEVDGKEWIISESSIDKLKDQLHDVTVKSSIKSSALVKKTALNPITCDKIPVFESKFVNTDHATGVVMSVPSHAPFDYTALKALEEERNEKAKEALKHAHNMIRVPDVPKEMLNAQFYCEKHNVSGIDDKKNLEKATSETYKVEFHKGEYTIDILKGLDAEGAKDKAYQQALDKGLASNMYETTARVVCRCTTECRVKILENQWFLNYKDADWKIKTKEHLKEMTIYPEEARQQFENTVDWLEMKACARRSGLGTPLPFDKKWIVETLSDSTIYNAYYTISNFVNDGSITADELDDTAFDFIFSGKDLKEHAKLNVLEKMKASFEYWYPVNIRCSGKDLIQNHLTFFIMQHVALFDKKYWPRGIAVNGYVNVENEKMSKSKGNIIPFRNLLDEFGPDLVRLNMVSSAEGIDDANWASENVSGFTTRINAIADVASQVFEYETNNGKIDIESVKPKTYNDRILLSITETEKKLSEEFFEQLKYRSAAQHSFFNMTNALKDYVKGTINYSVLKYFLYNFLTINAPMMAFSAEEIAEQLGFAKIEDSRWPKPRNDLIDEKYSDYQKLYDNLRSDIASVLQLVGRKNITPSVVKVYPAQKWTFTMLTNNGRALQELMQDEEIKEHGKEAVKLYKKLKGLNYSLTRDDEIGFISEISPVLSELYGIDIVLVKGDDDDLKQGMPSKPGLFVVS